MYSAFNARDFAVTVAFSMVKPISAKLSPVLPSASASDVVYASPSTGPERFASTAESTPSRPEEPPLAVVAESPENPTAASLNSASSPEDTPALVVL